MCEAHLQCWRVRVQSVVHWIWVDVIPGWLGHSFTHLSRFADIFRSALRHCFSTSRRLVLIAVSAKSPFYFFFHFYALFSRRSTARSTPTAVIPALCLSIPYKLRAFHEKLLPNGPLKTPDKSAPNDTRLTFFFITGCTRTVPNLIFEWDGW